jgi:hypothetical protein
MNETELIVRIDRIYKEYEDSKRFDCKCRVYYKHKNNQDKKIKIGSFQIQANENENKIDIKKSKKLTYRFDNDILKFGDQLEIECFKSGKNIHGFFDILALFYS